MLALGFVLLGSIYYLTLFMQNVQGYSAIDTGIRSLPLTLMIVLVAPFAGRFSGRLGPRLFVVVGLLLAGLSMWGLSGLVQSSPYSAIWPWLVVFGVGAAMSMPVLAATIVSSADDAKSGIASGVLNTSRQLGTALGVAVLGSIASTIARNDWSIFTSTVPAAVQAKAQALEPLVVVGQGATAGSLAGKALGPAAGQIAASHAFDAFCHGMQQAFLAALVIAIVAAAIAAVGLFPARQPAGAAVVDPSLD
jgi:MFS family permease